MQVQKFDDCGIDKFQFSISFDVVIFFKLFYLNEGVGMNVLLKFFMCWLCCVVFMVGVMSVMVVYVGKVNDIFIYVFDSEVENISQYYNNLCEGVILVYLIWDMLIYCDFKINEYKL